MAEAAIRAHVRASLAFQQAQDFTVNVSRDERRVLHVLAQGGAIMHYKDDDGRLVEVVCLTREGWCLTLCTLDLFKRLRKRGLVSSRGGGPYRITKLGLQSMRTRPNER
jgi:uncharacterized protein YjhX (UPF0386 family)